MIFIYPKSMLAPSLPDEMFQAEATAMNNTGFNIATINLERLTDSPAKISKPIDADALAIYRGWMLTPIEYQHYCQSIINAGAIPISNLEQYLSTHYLPNWYPLLADLTPETIVLSLTDDWLATLNKLNWPAYFIKDYVKSLKTSTGAIIKQAADINIVVAEMEKYRGVIEGGLCIRRVEDFLPDSERRYFVIDHQPYCSEADHAIPEIVHRAASRIRSRFFSIDVVLRRDGQLRVVEVGDGQVSDLVGWDVARFVNIWAKQH